MALIVPIESIRNKKHYKPRRECLPQDFRKLYRLSSDNVDWLASHFLEEVTESRGGALTEKQQMIIFLRYMADPGFQTGVAEDVGVDQTTVSRTIKKVKDRILAKAHIWIKFPKTHEEIHNSKTLWQSKNTIPSVIGVIDCTHVRISKPSASGDEYINRKNYPSINVQATCDASEKFTSVSAEWTGSTHDSRIFRNSQLRIALEKMQDCIILGDSGYGITPYLLTPYKNPQTRIQKNFNLIYAKERVVIERCFGQLKRRFPILAYKVRLSLENVPGTIVCCVFLHNISKYLADPEDFDEVPDSDHDNNSDDDDEASSRNVRQQGQRKRDEVATCLFNISH